MQYTLVIIDTIKCLNNVRIVDVGIVINLRKLGENSYIVSCLLSEHGLYKGFVGNKTNAKHHMTSLCSIVHARWYARLDEHLGSYTLETIESISTIGSKHEKFALYAISSMLELLNLWLNQADPAPKLFNSIIDFVTAVKQDQDLLEIIHRYIEFELVLLEYAGIKLDLFSCASYNCKDASNLAYVSPRSGRAVSLECGKPYKKLLMTLPEFMTGPGLKPSSHREIIDALNITTFFVNKAISQTYNKKPPSARDLLTNLIITHYIANVP